MTILPIRRVVPVIIIIVIVIIIKTTIIIIKYADIYVDADIGNDTAAVADIDPDTMPVPVADAGADAHVDVYDAIVDNNNNNTKVSNMQIR